MSIDKERLTKWFDHMGFDSPNDVSAAVNRAIESGDPHQAMDELIDRYWDEDELQKILPEWIECWKEVKEEATLSWEDLAKEIDKMSPKHRKQTVCISNGGSDTFGKRMKQDNLGNPYIQGF